MKGMMFAIGLAVGLSGCASAPSAGVAVPPGVTYVAPYYPLPGAGYVWDYHPRYGWGWNHPSLGWHRGWR